MVKRHETMSITLIVLSKGKRMPMECSSSSSMRGTSMYKIDVADNEGSVVHAFHLPFSWISFPYWRRPYWVSGVLFITVQNGLYKRLAIVGCQIIFCMLFDIILDISSDLFLSGGLANFAQILALTFLSIFFKPFVVFHVCEPNVSFCSVSDFFNR